MRPHPRIRETIKWGGAAGAVACIALMVVSRWWTVHVGWVWHMGVTFHRAQVIVDNDYLNRFGGSGGELANKPPDLPGFRVFTIEPDPPVVAPRNPVGPSVPAAADYSHEGSVTMTDIFDYLVARGNSRNTTMIPGIVSWQVVFPLYVPLILFGGASAAAWAAQWRIGRRVRLGLCPKCHYDRAGLAAGAVCPECGAT